MACPSASAGKREDRKEKKSQETDSSGEKRPVGQKDGTQKSEAARFYPKKVTSKAETVTKYAMEKKP